MRGFTIKISKKSIIYFEASPLAVGIKQTEGVVFPVCCKKYSSIKLLLGEYSPNFENPPPPIAIICCFIFFSYSTAPYLLVIFKYNN